MILFGTKNGLSSLIETNAHGFQKNLTTIYTKKNEMLLFEMLLILFSIFVNGLGIHFIVYDKIVGSPCQYIFVRLNATPTIALLVAKLLFEVKIFIWH